ncbi:MAG: ATP-binding protein, partial [Acidimicrobiales bacterium]
RHCPPQVLAGHVAAAGAELVRIVPALNARVKELPALGSTDPDTERYLLLHAVTDLLARAGAQQPVVVVLEDLHWADQASLRLLRHVAASAAPMRLLLIATYRDAELSPSHPLTETLAALRRESGITRLPLHGLDDLAVVTFLERLAGHNLDDTGVGLAHAVCAETDGNPFFVGEVLRHLTETGEIRQDADGRWTARSELVEISLPDSVREVLTVRVARLGRDADGVLALASVIGREFDVELLSRVTGTGEEELLDILDGACRAALVRELPDRPGWYGFTHALVRTTLYQGLGPTRRARAHRAVAEVLERLSEGRPGALAAELAHHFLHATAPVDTEKAVAYARQAGEAALTALAPEDAVRWFSQALELSGQHVDPLLAIDVLIGLGNAQCQAGIPDYRETLLDAARRARELGTTDRLVAAVLANTRGWFARTGTIDSERVEMLDAALEALPRTDSVERALLLATLCNELSFGPLERRRALARDAKAVARRLADPSTTILVLILTFPPHRMPWTFHERMAEGSEALALAEQLGDPVKLFWASAFHQYNTLEAGDSEASQRCLATMRAVSERLREPILLWFAAVLEAAHALVAGDPDRAELTAADALQIGQDSGQPDAFMYYGVQLVIARHQQGRLGELVPLIAQAVTDHPGVPAWVAMQGWAHLEAGEVEEARGILEAATAGRFASLPPDLAWMDGVVGYAEVAIGLRAEPAARTLFDLLLPYREQVPFDGLVPQAPVSWYLGGLATVLGTYDDADEHFARAAAIATRGQMRFSEVRTELAWGQMLAERGRPGDLPRARALLTGAHAGAVERGYGGLERRAEAALGRLG